MRRLVVLTALIGLVTAAAATLSFAAPSGTASPDATRVLPPRPKLPALPAAVKARGKWLIGVKCDTPPFGWQDTSGRNRGYDVEVARQFAKWAFGSSGKVDFTCVTTASRIGTLTAGRVDIIIATLTWTAEREKTIDYSSPYYGAAGKLLVKNSVTVGKLSTWMKGKKIVSTSGSIYDRWIKNCFKNTAFQVVSSPSAGVLAVKNGQADALMYDDSFLVGVAANDPDLKMAQNKFLEVPWGIGIRQGEASMKAWVNAAIRGMKARDKFWAILKVTIPRRFYKLFKKNAPGPTITLKYPRAAPPENSCPS
jgi:polar amino acid transport system substrate-binding protein